MPYKPINIGFGNIVAANRIIAMVSPDSAPIKRWVQDAKAENMVLDATYGRRTRAVIITDAGYLVLSPLQPETLANRMMAKGDPMQQNDESGV